MVYFNLLETERSPLNQPPLICQMRHLFPKGSAKVCVGDSKCKGGQKKFKQRKQA